MTKYLTLFIFWAFFCFASIVQDLKPIKRHASLLNGKKVLIYREFLKDGETRFLATDVSSLKTYFLDKEDIANDEDEGFEKTRLFKVLQQPKISSLNSNGYFLTIDLCSKPKRFGNKFEKELFEFLVEIAERKGSPVPVGIAVSEKWIKDEKANFEYIKDLERQKKLDIIWINHSKTHPVNDGKFLTAKNVNFEKEVLDLEKTLLENDEVPSLFFRFPGLVYNKNLQERLAELSLVSLDADAWLAKGQKIKEGSIILVHGNGNEHRGVKRLMREVSPQKSNFISIYYAN